MDTKPSRQQQTKLNLFRRRAAIVFGIVMTMPDAPATDTLEYLALKMVIMHWPDARADLDKGQDKLKSASRITRSILIQSRKVSSNHANNATFRAEFNIRRACVDLQRYSKRKAPLPIGFLLSAVEHSLTHEYRPWRELIAEAR